MSEIEKKVDTALKFVQQMYVANKIGDSVTFRTAHARVVELLHEIAAQAEDEALQHLADGEWDDCY